MIVILSPSKDMLVNHEGINALGQYTLPRYLGKTEKIIKSLKAMSPEQISAQMKINRKLAMQNYIRFQQWNREHSTQNSACSILSYTGEAYRGLQAIDFSSDELVYSQKVLRILSGFYGILRPLDLIQPYRFELGLNIPVKGIINLYEYWRSSVTNSLNEAISESPGEKALVNLASAEYSSVIDFQRLKFPVITPSFKEERSGQLKMVTVYTKRARGSMTRYIIRNKIEKIEELKTFSDEGYYFENQLSEGNNLLFVR